MVRFKIVIIAVMLLWMSGPAICETINWKQYDDGMRLAVNQGKKIFLHFRTDWCKYCGQMDRETFGNPAVVKFLSKHFVAVKVDGDREKAVGKDYKVTGYPDNRFLDSKGKEVHRLPGFVEPEAFLFFLEYIQSDSYKTMDPMQYYKSR
jgi:thioredoxin 1